MVVDEEDDAYDLTTASAELGSFTDLVRAANASDRAVDDIARDRLLDADLVSTDNFEESVGLPVVADEV